MPSSLPTKPHILVVDDEAPFREIIATALTKVGYSVELAADGHEAERLIGNDSFDLVITDVIMPDGDGIEMIMNLHASKNGIPIIAMTGAHKFTDLYLKTAHALGAYRVLAKPFKISELLDTADDILSGRMSRSGSRLDPVGLI
jgi:two-component system, NtrC family, nitrogen regulation response regulator GlnG